MSSAHPEAVDNKAIGRNEALLWRLCFLLLLY